jgi:hypothetical protein
LPQSSAITPSTRWAPGGLLEGEIPASVARLD